MSPPLDSSPYLCYTIAMQNRGQNVAVDADTAYSSFEESMSAFDSLPIIVRQVIAQAPRKFNLPSIIESWRTAQRNGMGDGEFAVLLLSVFKRQIGGDYLTPTYGHAKVRSQRQLKGNIKMDTPNSTPLPTKDDKAMDSQVAKKDAPSETEGVATLRTLLKLIPNDVDDDFVVYGYSHVRLTLGHLKEILSEV